MKPTSLSMHQLYCKKQCNIRSKLNVSVHRVKAWKLYRENIFLLVSFQTRALRCALTPVNESRNPPAARVRTFAFEVWLKEDLSTTILALAVNFLLAWKYWIKLSKIVSFRNGKRCSRILHNTPICQYVAMKKNYIN